MSTFTDYIKEQEELQILNAEKTKKEKLADFIRTIEDLNDEKFKAFAVDELGMEDAEAETLAYKMLKAFLLANDQDGDGEPDGDLEDLEDLGDDIPLIGLDDVLDDDEPVEEEEEIETSGDDKRAKMLDVLSKKDGGVEKAKNRADKLSATK